MFIVEKLFKELEEKKLQPFFSWLNGSFGVLKKSVPNGSFSEHFFHIFLKAESQDVIILCKLYVVYLYLHITLTNFSVNHKGQERF